MGEVRTDVAIVGGGMMGLMCADAWRIRGREVCVIESEVCGGGASGRSSGFITPDSELELSDIVTRVGARRAKQIWDFGRKGVEAIRGAITGYAIACDYVPQDSLFVATSSRAADATQREFQTHQALGYPAKYYEASAIAAVIGSTRFHGAVRTDGTFGLDGYRFCQGLRDRLVERGGRVFENSEVTSVEASLVTTRHGRVQASHVIVCTDRWLPRLGLAPREIYHVQTFLAVSAPLAERDIARIFPSGPCMVWETDLIYHYFRLTGDRRLLIGGGTLASTYAGHEQHHAETTVGRLGRYLRDTFPGLEVELVAVWPGLIGISKDFGPVIGTTRSGIHFGGGAAGLPWAAAIGRYLAEKVATGRSELDDVLSVDRPFPLSRRAQALIGKRAAFALSHGLVKWRSS
jgi:gamma-glutamylputrescine oxidase